MGLFDRNLVHDKAAVQAFSARVYGWMAMGLGLTAAVAGFLYATGVYAALLPYWWIWAIGTLGVAMAISAGLNRISAKTATMLFLVYATLEGLLFGTFLPAYAAAYGGGVIWAAFATAAAVFGAAMCYGIFTKSDLTAMGRILSFALIGLIAISLLFFVLSFFMQTTWAMLFISYLGLIIFVGLTAYDAQTIRQYASQVGSHSELSYKLSIIMALRMYINVIMIFWYLLQIFSSSQNRK